MSIIYVVIAKTEDRILCEYTDFVGNFEQISRSLLKEVHPQHKATFSYDDIYYFHYLNSGNVTYMCMCNDQFSKRSAYTFLEDVKNTFLANFSLIEIEQSLSYTLSEAFKDKLKSKIDYYNNRIQEIEAISRALNNEKQTESLLESCIDKTHIDIIVKKNFEPLNMEVSNVRRTVRMRRMKIILIFLFSFIKIIAYFCSIIFCNGFEWKGCRNE